MSPSELQFINFVALWWLLLRFSVLSHSLMSSGGKVYLTLTSRYSTCLLPSIIVFIFTATDSPVALRELWYKWPNLTLPGPLRT